MSGATQAPRITCFNLYRARLGLVNLCCNLFQSDFAFKLSEKRFKRKYLTLEIERLHIRLGLSYGGSNELRKLRQLRLLTPAEVQPHCLRVLEEVSQTAAEDFGHSLEGQKKSLLKKIEHDLGATYGQLMQQKMDDYFGALTNTLREPIKLSDLTLCLQEVDTRFKSFYSPGSIISDIDVIYAVTHRLEGVHGCHHKRLHLPWAAEYIREKIEKFNQKLPSPELPS